MSTARPSLSLVESNFPNSSDHMELLPLNQNEDPEFVFALESTSGGGTFMSSESPLGVDSPLQNSALHIDRLPSESDQFVSLPRLLSSEQRWGHEMPQDNIDPTPVRKPKFKRRVIKPVLGNNHSGRRGVPTCAQCRKRKSKCIYDDPSLPCQFCSEKKISEPCVKLWGKKRQGRIENSRPLTRYDPSISSKHLYMLQFAFYEGGDEDTSVWFPITLFIRVLVSAYGLSIEHYGLRHAIIAYICRRYEIGTLEDQLESCGQACGALKTKIGEAVNVDEGDLFASYFLALYSSPKFLCDASDSERQSLFTHTRGCLALARHLYDRDYATTGRQKAPSLWYFIRVSLLRYLATDIDCPEFEEFSGEFNRILGIETFSQFNSSLRILGHPYHLDTPTMSGLSFDEGESLCLLLRRLHTLKRYACKAPLFRHSTNYNAHDSNVRLILDEFKDDPLFEDRAKLKTVEGYIIGMLDHYFDRKEIEDVSIMQEFVFPRLSHLTGVILLCLVNRFLLVLLAAPSLFDGLLCPRSIQTGRLVVDYARCMWGLGALVAKEPKDILKENGYAGRQKMSWKILLELGREYTKGTIWDLYSLDWDGAQLAGFFNQYFAQDDFDTADFIERLVSFEPLFGPNDGGTESSWGVRDYEDESESDGEFDNESEGRVSL